MYHQFDGDLIDLFDRRQPMRLSRKSDYALRALFTLVDEYCKGPFLCANSL